MRRDSLASWLFGVALRVSSCARSSAARRRRHEKTLAARRPVVTIEGETCFDERNAVLHAELGRLSERLLRSGSPLLSRRSYVRRSVDGPALPRGHHQEPSGQRTRSASGADSGNRNSPHWTEEPLAPSTPQPRRRLSRASLWSSRSAKSRAERRMVPARRPPPDSRRRFSRQCRSRGWGRNRGDSIRFNRNGNSGRCLRLASRGPSGRGSDNVRWWCAEKTTNDPGRTASVIQETKPQPVTRAVRRVNLSGRVVDEKAPAGSRGRRPRSVVQKQRAFLADFVAGRRCLDCPDRLAWPLSHRRRSGHPERRLSTSLTGRKRAELCRLLRAVFLGPPGAIARHGNLADVVLRRGVTVSGRCVDLAGKALAGAKIQPGFAREPMSSLGRLHTTDPGGRFRLNIPDGQAPS